MTGLKRLAAIGAALMVAVSPAASIEAETQNHEIWVLDQLFYPTPKDPTISAEILNTHSMDALIEILQRHGVPFDRQQQRLDTALFPPDLYAQISALPAGEPFIAPKGEQSVASVIIAHEPVPDPDRTPQ